MPGFDGTGPDGRGPMTGRGLGPCGRGLARGSGFGFGRGTGWRRLPVTQPTTEVTSNKEIRNEIDSLKKIVEDLKKRIDEFK